jgi:hypothetical protein
MQLEDKQKKKEQTKKLREERLQKRRQGPADEKVNGS